MLCDNCNVIVCIAPPFAKPHEMVGWFNLMTKEHIKTKHDDKEAGVLFSFGVLKGHNP